MKTDKELRRIVSMLTQEEKQRLISLLEADQRAYLGIFS